MVARRLSEFKAAGFLHLKGLFSDETVDGVRHQSQRIFGLQMLKDGVVDSTDLTEQAIEAAMYRYFRSHRQEFIDCGKQAQYLISLHRMSVDPRIEQILRELGMAFPNISQRPNLYISSRHVAVKDSYWLSPAHQDWRSMQGSVDAVVVWVALVDVNESLGALQVVPGSHQRGLLAKEFVDDFGIVTGFREEEFVSMEMRKGDALVFSAFLVHRSGINRTQDIRWSAQFRYNNLAEPTFIRRGYPHAFIYKPEQELLTPDFTPDAASLAGLWTTATDGEGSRTNIAKGGGARQA